MIHYVAEHPSSLVRWRGSVAPKSLRWAVACALLAVLYHCIFHLWTDWSTHFPEEPTKFETTAWGLLTYILGFLVVFRAQRSYNRYWEGITLVEKACGVWLNGFSNLIAFCSTDPDKQEQVEEFQYVLSRLMSLLFCYCMSDISNLDRSRFPHLDLSGIDPACLEYLEATSAKQNVALQWIQRMVVEKSRNGVIDIAAPILSRVFQELSIGIVHFMDAKKISVVPFPFGFAQMVWVMLVFFSVLPVPVICAMGMKSMYSAGGYTFLIVLCYWSIHHLAVEIELPFGDDPNDLPLEKVNHRFNKVLQRLLEMSAQQTPSLLKKPDMSMRFMRRKSSVSPPPPVSMPMLSKMRSLLGDMDSSATRSVEHDSFSRHATIASLPTATDLDSQPSLRASAPSARPASSDGRWPDRPRAEPLAESASSFDYAPQLESSAGDPEAWSGEAWDEELNDPAAWDLRGRARGQREGQRTPSPRSRASPLRLAHRPEERRRGPSVFGECLEMPDGRLELKG